MTRYAAGVRQLFARVVLLLSVLLMPLGMTPAAAGAAAHHAMAAMPLGHCDGQAPKHDAKAGFAECTMACSAALPAADLPTGESAPPERVPLKAPAAAILRGVHPDIATPPPRLA
ncbi:MAG: hypothetical protein ACM3ZV_06890 [Bacillota bacterium]